MRSLTIIAYIYHPGSRCANRYHKKHKFEILFKKQLQPNREAQQNPPISQQSQAELSQNLNYIVPSGIDVDSYMYYRTI